MTACLKQWWFSLLLIPVYIGMFHLWVAVQNQTFFVISGTVCALVLAGIMVLAHRQGYFASKVDAIGHALVILDIWLEAVMITIHNNHGFYVCAVAFIFVLGAYRTYALRRKRALETAADAAGDASSDG